MTQLVAFSFLVLFTVLMIVIGLKTAQKAKTIDGFLLGGRKIGPWISAFSYRIS